MESNCNRDRVGCQQVSSVLRKSAIIVSLVAVSAGPLWSQSAIENELPGAEMTIRPSRCVALHQGQVCYQNIHIEWQAHRAGDYCIFWELSDEPLRCWHGISYGEFEYDFQATRSVAFRLKSMQPEGGQLKSEMRVSWVHKARKRNRLNWRLF